MRSKLFEEKMRTVKTKAEKWVRIFPDSGDGYRLFDVINEIELGRILFDKDDNWIYDGSKLNVHDQEDIAGFIAGNQKEMNELLQSLK